MIAPQVLVVEHGQVSAVARDDREHAVTRLVGPIALHSSLSIGRRIFDGEAVGPALSSVAPGPSRHARGAA